MFINIPKIDCYQYYLLLAFYLDEYSDTKELAFNLFQVAYEKDSKSFPRIRFYQYLDNFDYNDIKAMKNTTKINLVKLNVY